jgi:hypothetical protein
MPYADLGAQEVAASQPSSPLHLKLTHELYSLQPHSHLCARCISTMNGRMNNLAFRDSLLTSSVESSETSFRWQVDAKDLPQRRRERFEVESASSHLR